MRARRSKSKSLSMLSPASRNASSRRSPPLNRRSRSVSWPVGTASMSSWAWPGPGRRQRWRQSATVSREPATPCSAPRPQDRQPRTLEMAPESTRAASLTWRLNHNTLEISDRHVLILDKGANLRCRPPPAPHRRGAIRSKADRRGRRPPTRRNRPRWRPHRTCRTPPPAALGAQRQHPPHLPGRTWSALSAPRRRHRLCGRLVCPQRPGPSRARPPAGGAAADN